MEGLDKEISDNQERVLSENYGTFLDCDVEARISGEMKITEIKSQERENTRQLERQKKISSQVSDVQNIASKLRRLVMSVGNSGMTREAFSTQVKGYLDQIEGIMNSEHDGSQTLAGREIKEKTVNIKDLPEIEAGKGIDYSYYVGEAGDQSIKINDDAAINLYPITGRHDAFAKTIQSARLLLTIDPKNIECLEFTEAQKLGREALDHDFPDAIYKIGIEKEKLNDAIKKAPELAIIEADRIIKANKISQMEAINNAKTLEHSRDITLSTLSKHSILDNRNIETIMRGFPQS
ncbi:MAG: hypothetical protein NWS47_00105 [Alphaproteobacteria bacterium]|nr:hypothetical protein [Alphaproteobacteria bacterium]